MKRELAPAVALMLCFGFCAAQVDGAMAATVQPGSPASFELETSSLPAEEFAIVEVRWDCTSCVLPADNQLALDVGRSLQWDFGSTLNGAEFGSFIYLNPIGSPVTGVSGMPQSIFMIPDVIGGLPANSPLFATARFVDDEVRIDNMALTFETVGGTQLRVLGEPINPIPLPA